MEHDRERTQKEQNDKILLLEGDKNSSTASVTERRNGMFFLPTL